MEATGVQVQQPSGGAEGDVAPPPWVAGNHIAWDLIHSAQGTAPRRLRPPVRIEPPPPEPEPEPELREWLGGVEGRPAADHSVTTDADVSCWFGAGPASAEAIAALQKTTAGDGEARERGCAVCLDDFEPGEALRRMPCAHSFHECCIVDWLRVSGVCPLCRHQLPWLQSPASRVIHIRRRR